MRKLSMVLAGAAAVAGLALTGGTAGASTVHTESASKCGTKWCAAVTGKKLKVETMTVWRADNKKFTGYPYVEVAAPHHKVYFLWWNKVKGKKSFKGKLDKKGFKTFPNKTTLCIGVAPSQKYQDYAGDACFTVHKYAAADPYTGRAAHRLGRAEAELSEHQVLRAVLEHGRVIARCLTAARAGLHGGTVILEVGGLAPSEGRPCPRERPSCLLDRRVRVSDSGFAASLTLSIGRSSM